ncbi:MAG: hypothetical protein EP344_15385 [Bacteroidetes bacterium]|nr:MAG: hypothetical protein EP344_15385 [Bacteroidota bacterium]
MNTTFRAGWLIVAGLFAVLNLHAQSTVQENLLRADKQFDLYAYNLALRTYEQVIKEQPNNAHALSRIGDCHFQLNKPQESLSWYDRAVLRSDVEPATLLKYGKALMQTGDYIGAKKWFLMYAEQNPVVGRHYAEMCDFALHDVPKTSMFKVLDEPLNTAAADYAPAFYLSKIVYNSARTDIKRTTDAKTKADWTGSAYNQLYVTQPNPGDNYLQQPAFYRSDVQQNFNEGPVTFSADGNRVAYCRNNFIDGTRQIAEKGVNMSLYIADVVNGNWINERAFPYNGSEFATGFPSLSEDGNTLYFASNRDGGLGGWDIYVSQFAGGQWSVPRNLGPAINTAGNEVTPFITGNTLYFSSDWHKGLGGLDIFRADVQDFVFTNVTHLGAGINSPRDDYGFIIDPKRNFGYLTSNRPEGRGNEDIWQVRKTVDEFVITVTDPQRNPISSADIDFSACNAGIKQSDASGRYSFAVAAGKANCRVTVRKAGYRATVVPVQSEGDKNLTAVLEPEYGTTSQPAAADLTAPATYSTTNYTVQSGQLELFTIYVRDESGQAIPAAELNLGACGLGTFYTDYSGKGTFYFPRGSSCTMAVKKDGKEEESILINDQTTRQLNVILRTDQRTKYVGLVLDATTRQPVQGAMVVARSRQGGYQGMSTTNSMGLYTLMMRPYQTYDIVYSKDGYQNYSSALQTSQVTSGDMQVSPVYLHATPGITAPATYSVTQPTSGGMISLADLEEVAAGSTPPVSAAPETIKTTKPAVAPASAPVIGYSVQLAANPTGFTEASTYKYDALSQYGNMYSVQEGSVHKLRLGVYSTRAEAEAVHKEVTGTVSDAFIVKETQGDASLLVSPQIPDEKADLAVKGYDESSATIRAEPGAVRYAVQVASWPADAMVVVDNYTNLSGLGYTYVKPESNRLRVRVGTWATYAEAEGVKAQVVQLGYKDALVITEKMDEISSARLLQEPVLHSTPVNTLTAKPATYSTAPGVTPISGSGIQYYVRVCALDNPNNFDARNLSSLGGVVEKWPIGSTNKTAVMLTGYSTPEQAKAVTDKLRSGGFPDAYIIADENGNMRKYGY